MIPRWIYVVCGLLTACTAIPDTSSNALDWAEANRRQNRPVQALFQLERLAVQSGWTDDTLRMAGSLRRDLGDRDGALAAWAQIAQPDALLLRDMARLQIALERWGDASETLARLTMLDQSNAQAFLAQGLILAAAQPTAARAALTLAAQEAAYRSLSQAVIDAIDASDRDTTLPLRVGIALLGFDEWAYAELAFDQAVGEGTYPIALAYRGLARALAGKSGETDMREAVLLAPDDARIRYVQGVYLRQQADTPGAIDALGQAILLDAQNPIYYVELAMAYRDARELTQAERWLQVAVDVSGGSPQYEEILALFYADEAENLTLNGITTLRDLVGELPEDVDLQAGYGWALYLAGDLEGGRALIENALTANPSNPRAQYYQARVWLDEGSLEQARPLLISLAEGESPFSALARALLEELDA